MWDFLRHYQLDIMLVLIGVCGITAFFVMNIKNVTSLDDDDTHEIYTALSGDQVALTDIRIISSQ